MKNKTKLIQFVFLLLISLLVARCTNESQEDNNLQNNLIGYWLNKNIDITGEDNGLIIKISSDSTALIGYTYTYKLDNGNPLIYACKEKEAKFFIRANWSIVNNKILFENNSNLNYFPWQNEDDGSTFHKNLNNIDENGNLERFTKLEDLSSFDRTQNLYNHKFSLNDLNGIWLQNNGHTAVEFYNGSVGKHYIVEKSINSELNFVEQTFDQTGRSNWRYYFNEYKEGILKSPWYKLINNNLSLYQRYSCTFCEGSNITNNNYYNEFVIRDYGLNDLGELNYISYRGNQTNEIYLVKYK